jgi:nitrogen-specific signal transduction histidine kinase
MAARAFLENYETWVRHKDGTPIPIWLSARVFQEDDREIGLMGHFRDLRERKRMEEQLLRSERLAALGNMAAHISHEIKNPLMLIGGFARQVLKDVEQDAEKNREKLQIIVDEVKRLEDFSGGGGRLRQTVRAQPAARGGQRPDPGPLPASGAESKGERPRIGLGPGSEPAHHSF